MKPTVNNYSEYAKTLPKAEEIYTMLFGKPQTHEQWAEKFNKVGQINRIINERR